MPLSILTYNPIASRARSMYVCMYVCMYVARRNWKQSQAVCGRASWRQHKSFPNDKSPYTSGAHSMWVPLARLERYIESA